MRTPTAAVLRQAMQAYQMRSGALAENLANADSPEYQRRRVDFEGALQRHRRALPGHSRPEEVIARQVTEQGPTRLEDELMELADTQMRTQLASRALHKHFALLRTGVTGRTM